MDFYLLRRLFSFCLLVRIFIWFFRIFSTDCYKNKNTTKLSQHRQPRAPKHIFFSLHLSCLLYRSSNNLSTSTKGTFSGKATTKSHCSTAMFTLEFPLSLCLYHLSFHFLQKLGIKLGIHRILYQIGQNRKKSWAASTLAAKHRSRLLVSQNG